MGALAIILTASTLIVSGSFPARAFRQSHNSQFHQNPYGFVNCTSGWSELTSFLKTGGKQPDGTFPATSYPIAVPAGDHCTVVSGYFTLDKTGTATWNGIGGAEFDT